MSWQRDTTWKPTKPDILQMHLRFRIFFFFFFFFFTFWVFCIFLTWVNIRCVCCMCCALTLLVFKHYITQGQTAVQWFQKQLVSINKTWVADLYLISTWQWVPPPQPSWMFNQNTDSPSVSQSAPPTPPSLSLPLHTHSIQQTKSSASHLQTWVH